jgi:hypothetical protein
MVDIEKEGSMQKIRTYLLVLLVLCLSMMLQAQEISWEIKKHDTNLETLKGEVTAMIEKGFMPFGLTFNNVELYVFYMNNTGIEVESWSINWYDSQSEMQDGLTESMNEGFLPTGIAYTGDRFYVLYIETESTAEAWRMQPSDRGLDSVQSAIQPYLDQGYVPFGITSFEGEYWTLMLKVPTTAIKSWLLETYEVGTHAPPINQNIEQGNIPWGIMYRGNEIDILYVGF